MEYLINDQKNKIQFLITRPSLLENIDITFNTIPISKVSSFVILRKDFEGLCMKDRIIFRLFHDNFSYPVFNNDSTSYPVNIKINRLIISRVGKTVLEENLISGIVLSSTTELKNLNMKILGSF